MRRLMTFVCVVLFSLTAAGCADVGSNESSSTSGTGITGQAAIFTPSDQLELSQNVPLGTWAKFVPEMKTSLINAGFSKTSISTTTSGTLEDQSSAVQDAVVSSVSSSSKTSDVTTLVVAPVPASGENDAKFGDFVSRSYSREANSTSASSTSSSKTNTALARLADALELAQQSGIRVIIVANKIPGFTPDLFLQMSSAAMIGEIQAKNLVTKLQLDSASSARPRVIEVLLPESKSNGFNRQFFSGIWSVLKPYFVNGKAVSASGTLTSSTTVADWKSVTFDATTPTAAGDEIYQRLTKKLSASTSSKVTTPEIDGIIASNDFVVSGVVKKLTKMGYTGSSVQINPSISVSGIVEGIIGKRDIQRSAVPDPSASSSKKSTTTNDSQWPIITGYGANIATLPDIVNGHLWMTTIEDRGNAATLLSRVCAAWAKGKKVTSVAGVKTSTYYTTSVPTIDAGLVAISADNLKTTLIDKGYASLSDAGL